MKLIRITQDPYRDAIVQVDDETAEAAGADGWGNVLDGSYPYADGAPESFFAPDSRPASFTRFLESGTAEKQSKGKPPTNTNPPASKPATPAAETPAAGEKGNKPDTSDKKPAKSEKE